MFHGGVTRLLVTGVSSFRSSLISPDRAPPPEGFALPDLSQVPEMMTLGLALEAVGALPAMGVAFPSSSSPLPAA